MVAAETVLIAIIMVGRTIWAAWRVAHDKRTLFLIQILINYGNLLLLYRLIGMVVLGLLIVRNLNLFVGLALRCMIVEGV